MEGQPIFLHLFVKKGSMDPQQIGGSGLVVISGRQGLQYCLLCGPGLNRFDFGTGQIGLAASLHVIRKIEKMNGVSVQIG